MYIHIYTYIQQNDNLTLFNSRERGLSQCAIIRTTTGVTLCPWFIKKYVYAIVLNPLCVRFFLQVSVCLYKKNVFVLWSQQGVDIVRNPKPSVGSTTTNVCQNYIVMSRTAAPMDMDLVTYNPVSSETAVLDVSHWCANHIRKWYCIAGIDYFITRSRSCYSLVVLCRTYLTGSAVGTCKSTCTWFFSSTFTILQI